MKKQNDIIKGILQSKMYKLDEEFTGKTVKQHLANKEAKVKPVTFDSISIIVGIISTIISLGLGMLINTELIHGLTMQHVIILFSVSVIFVIFRLLNEITTPNKVHTPIWFDTHLASNQSC
ncbi:MAG: hypothetical protein AMS27_14100 [Bacteroides sp. SM23_62_1]|nr:MAG: hypothetical protein AMS27_14100 [Bacteroides sp. SM23_62_1]